MRRVLVISTLIAIAIVWSAAPAGAGGGGGGGGMICDGYAEGGTIELFDHCFQGTAHSVLPATTVTIINHGQASHTFTATDGSFDSGVLRPGESWDVTFADPGMVSVYCTLHGSREGQGMAGAVYVDGVLAAGVADERSNAAGWWPASTIGFALLSLVLAVSSLRRRGRTAADEREPHLV